VLGRQLPYKCPNNRANSCKQSYEIADAYVGLWICRKSNPGEEIMETATTPGRPPLPPFTRESAIQKVRLAEDGWNSRDPA
jgi:Protein of unknown function (DUF1348)